MATRFDVLTEKALAEIRDGLLAVPPGDGLRIARMQGEYAGLVRARDIWRQAEKLEDDEF